jgi:hypothetical protein
VPDLIVTHGDESGTRWTERVDATPARDGDAVGTVEIAVKTGSPEQEQIERLLANCNRLRDRVAELEAMLAERPNR